MDPSDDYGRVFAAILEVAARKKAYRSAPSERGEAYLPRP
jgi:hypothetical protein